MIGLKRPGANQWNPSDYKAYNSLGVQTEVKSFPNSAGAARPHATWKYKQMLGKMAAPEGVITEEEEEYKETDDTSLLQ